MRQATINDVARAAGVSKRTVSRVINGHPSVSDDTRLRVLRVAKELNYTPNTLAQKLARGKTGIIGVFVYEPMFPSEREDFFYPFMEGIEKGAQRRGYDLLLFTQQSQDERQGRRSIYAGNRNRTQLADGLILMGSKPNRDDLARLSREGVPFVFIGRREVASVPISWVIADYERAFYDATKRLIAYGHRKIGIVVRDRSFEADYDKLMGFQRALREAGISFSDQWICPTEESGSAMADHFLNLDDSVTAIMHCHNTTCAPLCSELKRRGVEIPRDVSMIAFDQVGSVANGFQNAYIQMPKQVIGEKAVSVLAGRIASPESEEEHVFLPCRFYDGQSIDVPPNYRENTAG